MAIYFVDGTNGDNTNSGTTMDTAWKTIQHAVETSGLTAGDIIFVRKGHVENPTTDIIINSANDGNRKSFIKLYGWPRAAHSIASSDWTQGSNTVTINDNNMAKLRHVGRFITAPDSNDYLITRIISSNSINIDRPYPGSSVSAQSATIKADEWWADDMGSEYGFDDSSWTIKESDWDADDDDLPQIDGLGADICWDNTNSNYWKIAGLNLKDLSDSSYGLFRPRTYNYLWLLGCLFEQSAETYGIGPGYGNASVLIDRLVLTGDNSLSSQRGLYCSFGSSSNIIRNTAIYNIGGFGLYAKNACFLDNVNIGVEIANTSADIYNDTESIVLGRDVKLGGTNGYFYATSLGNAFNLPILGIENYGKEEGKHYTYSNCTSIESLEVVSGSGDPEKRTNGADKIIKIVQHSSNAENEFKEQVFLDHVINTDTTSKSYRYYIQFDGTSDLTSDQIYLEVEYINTWNSSSSYHTEKVTSSQSIAVRTGASDWSQYLEVTGIQPANDSVVRIRIKGSWYQSGSVLYIDPKVEIS